ncbi:MAG TPA: response regulator [Longimicrobiaceae bacterium]|nr:response regulator [Longimicrobiaceae bacterium]
MEIILLVEDDSDARTIFGEALTERGYGVLNATQGVEGVHLARRQRPHLILMDLRMPVMDGLEAIRYLKSDERTARILVWGISAYLAEMDESDPRLMRFDRLLHKPIDPGLLAREVADRFGPHPMPLPS